MSTILYYSNLCQNCKHILNIISRSPVKDEMHFLCVDNRVKGINGRTHIKLSDGQQVVLPQTVTKVPALLLMNRNNHVLFGEEIMQHIQPSIDEMKQTAVKQTGEPSAYSLGNGCGYGVASDNYSFLDQSIESLSAKGDGGLRQIKNYATLEYLDNIETPPDDYTPNKIGSVNMEKIQTEREKVLGN